MKKRSIRYLSVFLATMMLMLTITQSASAASLPFKDVPSNKWYYSAVDYVYDNNLMNGITSNSFQPNQHLSRAMFVTVLGRMAGINPNQYPGSRFADVPTGTWYSPYIQWAASKGIVNGLNNYIFGTNNNISRQEIATIISRYLKSSNISLTHKANVVSGFHDAYDISSWARSSVDQMRLTGIMNGNANGCFYPKSPTTRAEAASVFMNLKKAIEYYYYLLANPHPELEAYRIYAQNDSWIVKKDTSYESKRMAIIDLYNDGVYEAIFEYSGTSWQNYTTVLLSYNNGVRCSTLYDETMGYIINGIDTANGRVLTGRTRGKGIISIMSYQTVGSLTLIDSYFPYNFPSNGGSSPESVEQAYNYYISTMKRPVYVDINNSNIMRYLHANGTITGIGELFL